MDAKEGRMTEGMGLLLGVDEGRGLSSEETGNRNAVSGVLWLFHRTSSRNSAQ